MAIMRPAVLSLLLLVTGCNTNDSTYRDTCSFPHSHAGENAGACASPGEECSYDTEERTFDCVCVAPEGVFECRGGAIGTCRGRVAAGEPCAGSPLEGCEPYVGSAIGGCAPSLDAGDVGTRCFCEDHHYQCRKPTDAASSPTPSGGS